VPPASRLRLCVFSLRLGCIAGMSVRPPTVGAESVGLGSPLGRPASAGEEAAAVNFIVAASVALPIILYTISQLNR
jgi:hypothetical protein